MIENSAHWRVILERALQINRSERHSRYFQLATIRPDGTPANRTVVFRGFSQGTNQLQIITDKRSEKIEQLTHQSCLGRNLLVLYKEPRTISFTRLFNNDSCRRDRT